ncbi:uncharacterized protein LOC125946125 [Dermacentor silvarum]|uniref:uncharacterized protein LOC125946125 n=1 Tax=Dermacentor silvarum TaxID=543639 RepID=UPI00210164DE|nr:uncharacterized protein LOC125946125 [Dermacentor silvarum]
MAPVLSNKMRPDFSYCSTVQVAEFLLMGKTDCLTKNSSRESKKLTFPDVNETRPSLDVFCQRHYTEYPGTGYKEPFDPSTQSLEKCVITCSDPARPHILIINDAPDGTPCDKTKPRMICLNGKCTRVKENHVLTFGSDVENSVVELK